MLVVDDQASSRDAMVDALRPLGYEVWPGARRRRRAPSLARERQPDVILLDIMMPGLDGYEVCRRLKADEETRLLPVVFLTGLDSRQARLQGLEAGATDFLSKPFDLVELEVRVRNLVNFRHLTQDLDEAEKMLFAVARAVEARDEETGDHCERLSRAGRRAGRARWASTRSRSRRCGAPATCTTSARSAFPTRSCSSPASSPTTSGS